MVQKLDIYLHGQLAAEVSQGKGGALTLAYTQDHVEQGSSALSLALPVQAKPYTNKPAQVFLEGLVPESIDARDAIAAEHGVSARSAFAMLHYIGRDCAGAVQFVESGDAISGNATLSKVSEQEIAQRLQGLNAETRRSWMLPQESWSLGGAQSKFALTKIGQDWYQSTGVVPSTHIFKPGIQNLKYQALNEHVCLRAASVLGLNAAQSEVLDFGEEIAIVVQRYDRLIGSADGDDDGNGVGVVAGAEAPNELSEIELQAAAITRVHQEDLCQAMGFLPTKKYESMGGPTAQQIIHFLRRDSNATANFNVQGFVRALIFNSLIGAPDAHAKNYSLLHAQGYALLAPLYDIGSSLAYGDVPDAVIPGGKNAVADTRKVAMRIGGASEFGTITKERWQRFAASNSLDEDEVLGWVKDYSSVIPEVFEAVFDSEKLPQAQELKKQMLKPLSELCKTVLETF